MILGYHYRVKISNYVVNIVVPDKSGDKLIEFARLALLQQFTDDEHSEGEPSEFIHGLCASGRLDSIEYQGPVYIDAKVVAS